MKLELEIEYHEQICGGMGCTPDGCHGHSTGVPAKISINGFELSNQTIDDFEPLAEDDEESNKEYRRWIATIAELKKAVDAHNRSQTV